MMKAVVWCGFVVLFALVTFFGLGPVLFADGSDRERALTFAVVLLIYGLLGGGLALILKRLR